MPGRHRCKATADAPVVKLHILVGTEILEHHGLLRLGQPAEIEFVVVAQEQPPLGGSRSRLGGLEGLCEGSGIGRCHRIKQVLVDVKIEHHVHAVAVVAEVFHVGLGQHIGFRKNNGVALPPLQEFAERSQHVILFDRRSDLRALG